MSDDESMPQNRVKPENKKAKIDTSRWPLLLKVKIKMLKFMQNFEKNKFYLK